MLLKGYRFGLMLQLAVGPICLFIFNLGSIKGFIPSFNGVLGVTIIDALFIFLAIIGIGELLKKEEVKILLKYGGGLVLILLGIKFIFDSLISPGTLTIPEYQTQKIFIEAMIITASNPLTIIIWFGVFTSKLSEEEYTKKEAYIFGMGYVLSTITFLTGIALMGSITKSFLPMEAVKILNIIVGLSLIIYGLKYLLKS